MTLTRRFDYAEFVEGYREACEKWGIDPAQGANGYQVVRVRAEQRRQLWLAEGQDKRRWWLRHELWLNCPPYRSDTEGEAMWNLFVRAYSITVSLLAQAARLRRAAQAAMSLAEVRQEKSRTKD